jgi:hypothetical protein
MKERLIFNQGHDWNQIGQQERWRMEEEGDRPSREEEASNPLVGYRQRRQYRGE